MSNEALYGVFRISGLITLTYLHLWKLLTSCSHTVFPSIRTKNHFPTYHSHYIGSVFIQEYPVFFFNWFKKSEWAKFFSTLVLCLNLLLTEYKHSRCFFPSLKIHSLWQAINGHSDTLVTQKRKWKQCIPSSWLIKCVYVCLRDRTTSSDVGICWVQGAGIFWTVGFRVSAPVWKIHRNGDRHWRAMINHKSLDIFLKIIPKKTHQKNLSSQHKPTNTLTHDVTLYGLRVAFLARNTIHQHEKQWYSPWNLVLCSGTLDSLGLEFKQDFPFPFSQLSRHGG